MPGPVNKQTYALKNEHRVLVEISHIKVDLLFRSLKFIILKHFIVEIKTKEDHD